MRPVSGNGETRNLSSTGVLFTTDAKVDIGETIEYIIHLSNSGDVDLHCLGKVIRMEGCGGSSNGGSIASEVAATLERYDFVRN